MKSRQNTPSKQISDKSTGSTSVPKTVAGGNFEITKKLGEGCFGEVFSGVDRRTGDPVAVKFECSSRTDLQHEVSVLKRLAHPEHPQGFTRMYHFGKEGGYNCLVMERLDRSLMDLSKACGGRFSHVTTALVAQQAVRCLELLHSRGIVHRDIKPENFMCGVGPRRHHLYIIDFGMAASFYSAGKHVPFHTVTGFSGNLRYSSINAHRMYAQSRRDDLEALGHMLYFFLLGRLPWSGLPAKNWREQNKKVMEKKEATPLAELNEGKPAAFREYLLYCRSLGFSSKPDYQMIDSLFAKLREILSSEAGRPLEDCDLEWILPREKRDCEPLLPRGPVSQPEDRHGAVPVG